MNQIKPIPNMPESGCFACGPANERGLGMKFFKRGETVYCNLAVPDYMSGWNNVVHGGILSTLLDETMGWGAIVLLRKYIFTKSMTVNYHRPVQVNDMLTVESEVKERTGEREVIMSARIINSRGELCATSTGIFSLMNKDFISSLEITDQKQIDYFEKFFESFDN